MILITTSAESQHSELDLVNLESTVAQVDSYLKDKRSDTAEFRAQLRKSLAASDIKEENNITVSSDSLYSQGKSIMENPDQYDQGYIDNVSIAIGEAIATAEDAVK
jgi:hypothetical protein